MDYDIVFKSEWKHLYMYYFYAHIVFEHVLLQSTYGGIMLGPGVCPNTLALLTYNTHELLRIFNYISNLQLLSFTDRF